MNWEALGAIGEIVGAVAVVVTLGYLAVQIRQNTRSVRASTHHSAARSAKATEHLFAESETVARVFRAGAREPDSLTGDERLRFDAMMRTIFAWYEDVYFQYRHAMIDRQYWEARQRSMMEQLQAPGISSWWAKNSHLFADAFVSHVARLVQDTEKAAVQGAEAGHP